MTKIYERIRTLWAFYNKKKVDSSVDNRMGLQRNLEASSAASIVDPYSLSNHEGTYVYYPLSDLKKSPDDDPHRTMTSFIYQARDNLRSLKSEYFKEIAMLDQQWKKDKRAQNVRLVQSEKQLEVLAMHEYIQRKSIELYPYQLSPRSSNRTRSARSVSAKNYPVCRIKKNQVSLKHSGRGKDAEKCGKIDGKIETELYLQRNSLSSHMQNKLSFYIKNNLLVDMIDFLDVQPTNVSVSPSLCPMTGPVLSLPILNLLVNSPDRNGMTPLFYAVLDGRTSLVR